MEAASPNAVVASPRRPARRRSWSNSLLRASFFATAAVFVANVWMVPRFKKIFADFGSMLPRATEFAIAVSSFCMSYWFVVIPVIVLLYVGLALLTWQVDRRIGLAAAIVLLVLCFGYALFLVGAMYLPLMQMMQDVRGAA